MKYTNFEDQKGDSNEPQVKAHVLDHEVLEELIESIKADSVAMMYSLDYTRNNPVIVYGARLDNHIATLNSYIRMLDSNTTVPRQSVLDARTKYSDHTFFATFDNWVIDRSVGMTNIQVTLRGFVQAYARAFSVMDKSMTAKHNLTVLSTVVLDSIDFIKRIRYDG